MKIEIWSDVVCPWCYIGKRRLESALSRFPHRSQVEIIWRSFELDPNAPHHFEGTANERLAKKYGMSPAQAAAAHDRITTLGAQEGLDYHFETAQYGNSFDAHRLIHLAAFHGLQGAMKERLLKAYFVDGLPISDRETLIQIASEMGIASEEARRVLESDAYAKDVRADEERAVKIGIHGVPFFLVNQKHGISGAQPSETFLELLQQVWAESPG